VPGDHVYPHTHAGVNVFLIFPHIPKGRIFPLTKGTPFDMVRNTQSTSSDYVVQTFLLLWTDRSGEILRTGGNRLLSIASKGGILWRIE
jgi:hypothetical protein